MTNSINLKYVLDKLKRLERDYKDFRNYIYTEINQDALEIKTLKYRIKILENINEGNKCLCGHKATYHRLGFCEICKLNDEKCIIFSEVKNE